MLHLLRVPPQLFHNPNLLPPIFELNSVWPWHGLIVPVICPERIKGNLVNSVLGVNHLELAAANVPSLRLNACSTSRPRIIQARAMGLSWFDCLPGCDMLLT